MVPNIPSLTLTATPQAGTGYPISRRRTWALRGHWAIAMACHRLVTAINAGRTAGTFPGPRSCRCRSFHYHRSFMDGAAGGGLRVLTLTRALHHPISWLLAISLLAREPWRAPPGLSHLESPTPVRVLCAISVCVLDSVPAFLPQKGCALEAPKPPRKPPWARGSLQDSPLVARLYKRLRSYSSVQHPS